MASLKKKKKEQDAVKVNVTRQVYSPTTLNAVWTGAREDGVTAWVGREDWGLFSP